MIIQQVYKQYTRFRILDRYGIVLCELKGLKRPFNKTVDEALKRLRMKRRERWKLIGLTNWVLEAKIRFIK